MEPQTIFSIRFGGLTDLNTYIKRHVISLRRTQEGQELDYRMCFHHVKSDPRTQTFALYAHAQARYVWRTTPKLQSRWSCDEPEKALLSVDIAAFLVYARKFICSLAFLFIFVFIWHTPMWSCVTCELRPSWRRNLMKRVYIPEARWCLEWPRRRFHVTGRHLNLRAHTRKPAK